MKIDDLLRLEKHLLIYAGGYIDARLEFMDKATDEQKEDLLAMIIYMRANNIDRQKIRFCVMHDIWGINNEDDVFFVPRSASYSKGDPCIVSFKE